MSQGEKQRVLIGRALMAEPEILMLDEPCNGLDFFSKAQLLENVKKLAEEQKKQQFSTLHIKLTRSSPHSNRPFYCERGGCLEQGKQNNC